MGRLVTFASHQSSAPLNGLGIDDSTALLIEASGNTWLWSVYGESHVYLVTPGGTSVKASYQDNQRLTYGPINVYRLDPSGAAGRRTIASIKQSAPTYHIRVQTGTIFTTENGGLLY
jgi:cyanophycinase-like exopeptidase